MVNHCDCFDRIKPSQAMANPTLGRESNGPYFCQLACSLLHRLAIRLHNTPSAPWQRARQSSIGEQRSHRLLIPVMVSLESVNVTRLID